MAMKVTEKQLARDTEKGVAELKLHEVDTVNRLFNKNSKEIYSNPSSFAATFLSPFLVWPSSNIIPKINQIIFEEDSAT